MSSMLRVYECVFCSISLLSVYVCVRMPLSSRLDSDFFCGRNTLFFGRRHYVAVLVSQVPKKYTDLGLSLLYISTLGTYFKFTRKNNFLALGVYFAQPCSSAAGRRFAASKSRLQYYRRIVSFPQQKFR